MKKLFLFPTILLATSCSLVAKNQNVLKSPQKPDLDLLLRSYNVNGYTKKTTFYLSQAEMERAENFHAGCNAAQRATYYNEAEDALLMGDFNGTFSSINSGYRTIENEEAVQHFRHVGEVTAENLFTSVEDDWSMEGQTVGGYYPTLNSLSEIIESERWNYNDDAFTYHIIGLTFTNSIYNDTVLQKFQYFAAPLLLQSDRFSWSSIKIEDKTDYLSIRIYLDEKDDDKTVSEVENEEVLISEAKVYKGINL